jgi:hypothetical protein
VTSISGEFEIFGRLFIISTNGIALRQRKSIATLGLDVSLISGEDEILTGLLIISVPKREKSSPIHEGNSARATLICSDFGEKSRQENQIIISKERNDDALLAEIRRRPIQKSTGIPNKEMTGDVLPGVFPRHQSYRVLWIVFPLTGPNLRCFSKDGAEEVRSPRKVRDADSRNMHAGDFVSPIFFRAVPQG